MAIFAKFQQIATTLQLLSDCGVNPVNVVIEQILSASEGIINGRHMILAGTNNYLGITFEPECIEAGCKAIREEGTGTTGSRMANGTYAGHIALENELIDFFNRKQAIVFSTGYTGILGILATLTGREDTIIADVDCHASIYDGCRLGKAKFMRFRHNDVDHLEWRLKQLKGQTENTLIVIEGIYSMLGDRAKLKEIVEIKNKYGAFLMIDEAHSMGILGRQGRGLAEEAGVEDDVDFISGTFSKSLGTIGGYCVSNHPELNLIRHASRPYIFTASSSPAIIASTRSALKILRAHPELREKLWENATSLYRQLQNMGFILGPEPGPVISVHIETAEKALELWRGILDRGVYVNMILPPATPGKNPLLRCSMSAAHTPKQVEHIVEAFASLRKTAGI
ncbi:MAG: serine palmitoyltransferase [Dissulfuribacterales bacterium]